MVAGKATHGRRCLPYDTRCDAAGRDEGRDVTRRQPLQSLPTAYTAYQLSAPGESAHPCFASEMESLRRGGSWPPPLLISRLRSLRAFASADLTPLRFLREPLQPISPCR